MNIQGQLTIKPQTAFIILKPKSRQNSNNIKSFVTFAFDNQQYNSSISKVQGINPSWKEIITIPYKGNNNQNKLYVKLIDKRSKISDQLIGELNIDVSRVIDSKNVTIYQMWMLTNGKVTSKIRFQVVFRQNIIFPQLPIGLEQRIPSTDSDFLEIPATTEINFPKMLVNQWPEQTVAKELMQPQNLTKQEQIPKQFTNTNDRIRNRIKKLLEQRDMFSSSMNQSQIEPQSTLNQYGSKYYPVQQHNHQQKVEQRPQQEQQDLTFFMLSSKIKISDMQLIHSEELMRYSKNSAQTQLIESEVNIMKDFNLLPKISQVEENESWVASPKVETEIAVIEQHKIFTSTEMDSLLSS